MILWHEAQFRLSSFSSLQCTVLNFHPVCMVWCVYGVVCMWCVHGVVCVWCVWCGMCMVWCVCGVCSVCMVWCVCGVYGVVCVVCAWCGVCVVWCVYDVVCVCVMCVCMMRCVYDVMCVWYGVWGVGCDVIVSLHVTVQTKCMTILEFHGICKFWGGGGACFWLILLWHSQQYCQLVSIEC